MQPANLDQQVTQTQTSSQAIALGTPQESFCSITIDNYTADTVSVSYHGLPGNQPQTYKNFVAIWEASIIPWQAPPLKQVYIENNYEQGSLVLDGLTVTMNSYIVGYGVGEAITSICTSSLLRAGGLITPPTNVLLGLDYIGTNSLSIHYETLTGYLPKTYNNWIGLWEGYASPFNAPPPLKTVNIDKDYNQGSIAMNNIALGFNTEYTLVYFMGKDNTTAACILNFNTKKQV